MENEQRQNFFRAYFSWHYTSAFREAFVIWKNFLVFFYDFFSISLLFKTFFSPWRRLDEDKPGILNIQDFISVLIINTLMRLVGAIARFFVITIGLCTLALTLILEALFFMVWLLLPLLVPALLITGITFLL